jgi:hypothetical protein
MAHCWAIIGPLLAHGQATDGPLLADDAGPVLLFLYWASISPPYLPPMAHYLAKLAKYAGQASCQLLRVCWEAHGELFP